MARLFDDASSQFLEYQGTPPVTAYPCTGAVWMYPDAINVASHAGLAIAASGSSQYLRLGIFNDQLRMELDSGGGPDGTSAGGTVSANAWVHGAFVLRSATDRSIYRNGGDKVTTTTSRAFPASADRTTMGRISTATPGEYFSGRLAYGAWWSVALADAEIAALGLGRVHPLSIRPDALVFLCPVGGFATPEPDHTAGQRHLTVTGATVAGNPPVALWLPYGPEVSTLAAAAPPVPPRRNLTLLGVS